MIIRFLFVSLFCFSMIIPQQPAHAGVLEFFFPTLRNADDDPAKTLQAPFADVEDDAEKGAKNNNDAVPLNLPHRAMTDITKWVVTVTSEVMTFSGDYKTELEVGTAYFDEGGRQQYDAFIEEKKILNVMASGKYDVRSYVRDTPILLNEGAVQGRYRWLYEVPLMISYLQRGVKDYKEVEAVNQNMVLRVQIGRSETAENDLGLQIERWTGKVQKMDKK